MKIIYFLYAVITLIVVILELTHNLGGHSGWIPWIFIWLVGIPLRLHLVTHFKITNFQFWETHGQPSMLGEGLIAFFWYVVCILYLTYESIRLTDLLIILCLHHIFVIYHDFTNNNPFQM